MGRDSPNAEAAMRIAAMIVAVAIWTSLTLPAWLWRPDRTLMWEAVLDSFVAGVVAAWIVRGRRDWTVMSLVKAMWPFCVAGLATGIGVSLAHIEGPMREVAYVLFAAALLVPLAIPVVAATFEMSFRLFRALSGKA